MTLTALNLVEEPAEELPPIAEDMSTEEFISWTLQRFANWRLVITTSFGMEGCALIDMYARHDVPLKVVYLDTQFLFPETYALRDRMVARYPHVEFENRGTGLSPAEQEEVYGAELWNTNPDLCCQLRKVDPMKDALADADVWITSIARHQSESRAQVRLVEWDWKFQVVKVNPLVHWDRERVYEYVKAKGVPYNPLHEEGYPSIGCVQCTRRVTGVLPHEYTRLGRWAGQAKTECGLHGRR